jgi:hypothetical protein
MPRAKKPTPAAPYFPEDFKTVTPGASPDLCFATATRQCDEAGNVTDIKVEWHGSLNGFVWVSTSDESLLQSVTTLLKLVPDTRHIQHFAPYESLPFRLTDESISAAVYLRDEGGVPVFSIPRASLFGMM